MLPGSVLIGGLPGHDGLLVLDLDGLQGGLVDSELGCDCQDCQEWSLPCHPVFPSSPLTPSWPSLTPGGGGYSLEVPQGGILAGHAVLLLPSLLSHIAGVFWVWHLHRVPVLLVNDSDPLRAGDDEEGDALAPALASLAGEGGGG